MSGSIPKEFIRDIVDMTDIVSLVDSYLPLKRKGKDHWGQCPFCDDGNNPSFSVSEQKQFYFCFKCRATGNVIGFLQAHQGYDFIESIESLAARNGIEVPYENTREFSKEKGPIYDALALASEIFENNLASSNDAENVRSYILEERKISSEVSKKFELGYSTKSWDALTKAMLDRGISEEILVKAGLAKKNKDGKLFDIFRDRLMFPIKDRKGRIVGFGGRVMNPDDQPKYLNTGETEVFQKSRELYGFFEALEERRDLNEIYVVEGYMDTIAMYEHGMKNSVATLGIATNRFHIQKLLQVVSQITFCFDGDDAGRGAAWGALKNVLPSVTDGTEISFLFLPEGEDPASLLEQHSVEDFKNLSKKANLLSEYFIERLAQASEITSLEKKASLAAKAMELLSTMQESSIKRLLESEVAKVTGLDPSDLKTKSKTTRYPDRIRKQIADVIGLPGEEGIEVSAKTGQGIKEVLSSLVEKFAPPKGNPNAPLQALLIDSWYDPYLGVLTLVRVVNGSLKKGQKIRFMSTKVSHTIEKLGIFTIITAYVKTDKGSIEILYDEGYRGLNALSDSVKFLTENLGLSGLILRCTISLKNKI